MNMDEEEEEEALDLKASLHQVSAEHELKELNQDLLVGVADQNTLEEDIIRQVDRALEKKDAERDKKLEVKIIKQMQ